MNLFALCDEDEFCEFIIFWGILCVIIVSIASIFELIETRMDNRRIEASNQIEQERNLDPSILPASRQDPSILPASRQDPSILPASRQDPSILPASRQDPRILDEDELNSVSMEEVVTELRKHAPALERYLSGSLGSSIIRTQRILIYTQKTHLAEHDTSIDSLHCPQCRGHNLPPNDLPTENSSDEYTFGDAIFDVTYGKYQ